LKAATLNRSEGLRPANDRPGPYRQQCHDARFTLLVGALSITALLVYYIRQELLLYGDAVAHINIARRVVDNRHPLLSLSELGTVWLPLQHIAMLPFVWIDPLWRSGIAGAIPGMVAYVLGALGIFRLVSSCAPRIAASVAAAFYALNPNLLYLQTTAMNEPIFLAFFIWALVYLDEFLRGCFSGANPQGRTEQMKPNRALEGCGITLAGGAFTRYDGWFVAAVVGVIVGWIFALWWRRTTEGRQRRTMAKSFLEFLLLNALVPVFWLVYTYSISGYALDFVNGPYSAKAIALRSTFSYPGQRHLFTAGLYFLKSARLNLGAETWSQVLFLAALAGTTVAAWRFRRHWVLLLLWLPLPFYAFSIAYGSVPIYIPVWYPNSYYNVRYGLELLPAFAVFIAVLAAFVAENVNEAALKNAAWCVLIGVVAGSYLSVYRDTPITLREARVNSRGRIAIERPLANYLAELPHSATLLMYTAEHAGALQTADIHRRNVISESEHPDWEWALLDPFHSADYVVACQGDPVWLAMRAQRDKFSELLSISAPGQSRCTIYRRKEPGRIASLRHALWPSAHPQLTPLPAALCCNPHQKNDGARLT
jgi:4-amino-4-deoxy-L-arabinose transferase-like glycosyltransferase